MSGLTNIIKHFEGLIKKTNLIEIPHAPSDIEVLIGNLSLDYSLGDISEFCNQLNNYSGKYFENIGCYLSILINSRINKGKELILDLRTTRKRLDFLGYKFENGRLLILGDVGSHLGCYAVGGYIELNGNAEQVAGFRMNGGQIRIKGNVGANCGCEMQRGEIYVEGDAGNYVGNGKRGGIIFVRGKRGFQ